MLITKKKVVDLFDLSAQQLGDLLAAQGYNDLGTFITVVALGMNATREVMYQYEYKDSGGSGIGNCFVYYNDEGNMEAEY